MSQKSFRFRTIFVIFLVLIFIPFVFIKGLREYIFLPSNVIGPVEPRNNKISFHADKLNEEIERLRTEVEDLKNERLKLINYYDREYTQKWANLESYLKQLVANQKGDAFADNYIKNLNAIAPLEWLPLTGQVIGEHLDQWERILEINRGSKHGVEVGLPVVSGACVIGQVIAVTQNTSSVGHITNDNIKIPCVLANSDNMRGLLVGVSQKVKGEYAKIKYLDRRGNIEIGQKVFSLGILNKFPEGFLLGTIRKKAKDDSAMYYTVEMEPAIPFYKITNVIILLPARSK